MAPKKSSSGKAAASKNQISNVPDSDYIVFGDDKKKKKGKAPSSAPESSSEPPKPTARQIVGGSSWTGKLPVNILSEFCQKQKWNKPDYSMRQLPGKDGNEKMYRSDVTLSKTDPKTRETTTVPSFRLPPSDVQLADQPSALEARHFAATYALFRIQSMKNIHMTLPPQFRDLWKGEFARLKKQDVEAGHSWKYDEDPFAADVKRQEIHKAMEERKEKEKKRLETQDRTQGDGRATGSLLPTRNTPDNRSWDHAPQAAMGQQIRLDVEDIIRQQAVWNPYKVNLTKHQSEALVAEVTKLGFRGSHVEESLEYCHSQQEVLEWLLIHLPEEDLPRWTFPSNYNAGITLASGDNEKEGKLKRLASAGYPPELCIQTLKKCGGDEALAAFELQHVLVPISDLVKDPQEDSQPAWNEETETLTAIFGENFAITGALQCSVSMSAATEQAFTVHFRCPQKGYPLSRVPAISVEVADIPAYVRLSATQKAIQYARSELLGEVMLYNVCQWLETELPAIIENPGRLSDLRIIYTDKVITREELTLGKTSIPVKESNEKLPIRRHKKDVRSSSELLEQWEKRQLADDQIQMLNSRQQLPAWRKRKDIVDAILSRQVTIVSGETGSGKSTQVVQFILDHDIQQMQGAHTNILCTQPRRVAALSLADRVSSERCSRVGDEVGYVIRGESKISISTKITFMTTGVLLRRLQAYNSMSEALANISHIFIDEVHERSLDTDYLLALLKGCIKTQPAIKIVLMSATLDAKVFSEYFGGPSKVALVDIEGRTFPVKDLYLEDILSFVNPGLGEVEVGKAIQGLGFGINYDLIRDVVHYIDQDLGEQSGSILIFLPGTMEIERCLKAFSGDSRFLSLPLHASLMPAEQRKVFPRAPAGRRKVIASTNVAETSITIDDIVAVIDTGKVKETNYDAENNIVRLEEIWASHVACKQRRGRAGRVRAGTCYKLFTRNTESKMPSKPLPEIQRVPLEQLCLSVKATAAHYDIADFLSKTITPPNAGAVSNAIKTLETMSALENNQLTALGMYLAMVPADLRCAKLLVYGTLFDCLEPCLTIASILTVKSPFVSPRAAREEANVARLKFSNAEGDVILDMKAYDEWSDLSGKLRYGQLMDWCSSNFISNQTMRDIASTRRQILDSLKDAGLVPFRYAPSAPSETQTKDSDQMPLLTALIAASLQPQLAQISFPSKKYIASMTGAKELDPEARTIKFFIPDASSTTPSTTATPVNSRPGTPKPVSSSIPANTTTNLHKKTQSLSRVFIHPASCLFSAQTFPRHSTHLAYFTKMMTSKAFIRDLTPVGIYSLLLFGGKLELDTAGRGLIIGETWKVRGWARIGVLISRLKVLLDEELRRRVEEGGVLLGSMSGSRIVQIVKRLLVLNGQDQ